MSTTDAMRTTCKTDFKTRYPKTNVNQDTYDEYKETMCKGSLWRKSRKYGHNLEYMSTDVRNYLDNKKKNASGTETNPLFDKLNEYMNNLDIAAAKDAADAAETKRQAQEDADLNANYNRGGSRRRRKRRSRRRNR
jgi:hypothetical protein